MHAPPGEKEALETAVTVARAKALRAVRAVGGKPIWTHFPAGVKPVDRGPVHGENGQGRRDAAAVAGAPVPCPLPSFKLEGETCLGALGIGSIRAQTPLNTGGLSDLQKSVIRHEFLREFIEKNEARRGHFRGEVYDYGVRLEKKLTVNPVPEEPLDLPPRGAIVTFSDKAARRLREAFMTLWVPGYSLWSFTLTTHQVFTPDQWRAIMKRFRMACLRSKWAGIWRVELQKRKTPHGHVAFWLPPGVGHDQVRDAWLSATGEANDPEAVLNAVKSRQIEADDTGWGVYMGMHDGKHKAEQLGWVGKQWGVWNDALFSKREPFRFELTPREHAQFLRVLRNLDAGRKLSHLNAQDERMLQTILRAYPGATRGGISIVPNRKPKAKPMHRGNLLRLVNGATIRRIIDGIKAGMIYG